MQQLRQAKAFGSFETNAKLAHAARESWPILWRGAWHDEMADLNASYSNPWCPPGRVDRVMACEAEVKIDVAAVRVLLGDDGDESSSGSGGISLLEEEEGPQVGHPVYGH
jgi:hypothetical protein